MSVIARRDKRDITIGHYTLTSTGLNITGRPTFAEHEGVGEFIQRAHTAAGWWLADWLRYGDSREDWRDRLEQAIDATGLSEKRLTNVRAVGAAVPVARRRAAVEFGLHEVVTGLGAHDQVYWLARAEKEGWTRSEFRKELRAAQRTKIIEGQALLEGQYRVIYADPPYNFSDSGATADGSLGKAERHYMGMTLEQICKLPVAAHALPNSVLFQWTPPSMLPEALAIITAWGFTYKTNVTWDKVLGNWGHYVRVHHEHLLIATRGSCMPDAPTPMPDSVQTVRRDDEHSHKPEDFRRLITKLYTQGPYLELFGRRRHEGWSVFGNDARLWARDAEATA